jgi:hypothetical protein
MFDISSHFTLRRNKTGLAIAGTLLLAALVGGCGGHAKTEPPLPDNAIESPAPAATEPTPVPAPIVYLAPLTGEVISEEQNAVIANRKPLAVMIDNIVEATPQAGIGDADVVYEALVEGGVTRYMAVFHSKTPEAIEPVRSARTPFLNWALEYDALYVHVGSAELDGPADAGAQIWQWGVHDMDLGTQPFDYDYVRDKNRLAPHNVLISAAGMWQKAEAIGFGGGGSAASWPFTILEGLRPGEQAPGFTVRFGSFSPNFAARWDWDPAVLRYVRSQFGRPQDDAATGQRLAFANVVVQYADAYVADGNGHVLIDNIGEGRAQVFSNGQLVNATWRKVDRNARTELVDAEGNPIPLLAGPTWIEVVPPSGGAIIN